jgi:hypothetical protein
VFGSGFKYKVALWFSIADSVNAASGETIDLTVLEEDLLNNNEPNNNDGQPAGKQTLRKTGLSLKARVLYAVLRIRIRDPVPFWPLEPGSGMGKKSRSGSGMNIPEHISESFETIWG